MTSPINAFSAVSIPAFLGGTAAPAMPSAQPLQGMPPFADSYAPMQAAPAPLLDVQSLQQELLRIRAEVYRLLAAFGQPAQVPAAPQPAAMGWLGQAWQSFTHLFAPQPSLPPQQPPSTPRGATNFVLSSFNVLSSSAGKSKGFAPGTTRIRSVADILKANRVSVVGFQEMAADQLVEFKKVAGATYATFAGASGFRGYHDTTLAWRKDTWSLVKADTITVPSYEGRLSKVPYVRLRNKQTGQEAYFVDAHNPANTRRHHHQERFRDAAARQEAALVKRLSESTGLPVFMLGDMNSVREAQEIFTKGAPLHAANPVRQAGIDWIFGTKAAEFSAFRRQRDGLIAKTTDHPVVFSNVHIDGK